MLSKHINTAFDGVNSESINWMKHYLNGGDDVGAAWNGICDSVSGYTYKYSNQFEFDLRKSDLTTDNLTMTAFGWTSQLRNGGGNPAEVYMNKAVNVVVEIPETDFDLTFARLPFPDLPGAIFVKLTSGFASTNVRLTFKDGVETDSAFRYNQFVIPIEDPNWTPDSILIKDRGRLLTQLAFSGGSQTQNNYVNWIPRVGVNVNPGFSKDITAYRLAGASMTFNCTAPALYKNGTIVAVGATTPYRLGEKFDVQLNEDPDSAQVYGDFYDLDIYAQDLPIGYSTISSVKSYHKMKMSEGAYCVLHNTQGVFLFTNLEDNHQKISVDYLEGDNGYICAVPGIRVYNNGSSIFYPFAFLKNKSIYDRYTSFSCMPRYFIPDTPITEWNTCVVSPSQINSDDTLIYTTKFNTYAECYVSSFSRLKPSVSMTSMYYPRLIEYLSGFYHKFDGIYPSAWNDGNHIWELFKRFLSSGALNAAVTAINPTAGQIVPIIQSIAQKYFNRIGSTKDKKLSKKEKQQTNTVAKDNTTLFQRNKTLNKNAKPFYSKKASV